MNRIRSGVICFALTQVLLVSAGFGPYAADSAQAEDALQLKFRLPDSDEGLPGQGPIRRYDWFRQLWQDRRAEFSQQVKANQRAVVFLGDSITQGWGPDCRNSFPGLRIANRGISGDTTRRMLIRLREDVLSLNPAAVVLLMGTSDLGYAKWAAALRPVLATLGFTETEQDSFQPEPGFTSLFNGRDLTGWGYRPTSARMLKARDRWKSRDPHAPAWPVVTEPEWFDGRVSTEDKRYQAINGRLVVTTPPEGRKIQQLWTSDEFPGDFVLKSEDRSASNATNATAVLVTRRRSEAVQDSCEF